jgi:hypothetical protein
LEIFRKRDPLGYTPPYCTPIPGNIHYSSAYWKCVNFFHLMAFLSPQKQAVCYILTLNSEVYPGRYLKQNTKRLSSLLACPLLSQINKRRKLQSNRNGRGETRKAMRKTYQHCFNPLHVYCRLKRLGTPKAVAVLLCQFSERAVFNQLRSRFSSNW